MMVASDAMHRVLSNDRLFTHRERGAEDLIDLVVASVIGGVQGPGASHLCALVSSQIDADKLDYLARDAHHSGLEIGFDTQRLLSRLELLQVREDNVDPSLIELRERAANTLPNHMFNQVGIAASGFGSFEQMLIGRTFLYDRLYHHHKVRAAEAMAQRLLIVAERDHGKRFELSDLFIDVDDDTLLRILSRQVSYGALDVASNAAAGLAKNLLDRDLLHRAFAFRGRFIASPPGLSDEKAEQNRSQLWRRIVKEMSGLRARFELGAAIHDLAIRCAKVVGSAGHDAEQMFAYESELADIGPEQIIVDLPMGKAEAIRILARYPTGNLKIPEFSFNPVKWADAYELQKRTGYVFCPRGVVPIVAIASKILFLARFGVTMAKEADGYIKAQRTIPTSWLRALVDSQVIDQQVADYLSSPRHSLLSIRAEDLKVPDAWIGEDPDFADQLATDINGGLKGGLTAEHLSILGRVLEAMYTFVDNWMSSGRVTSPLDNEEALQRLLRDALNFAKLHVDEGNRVGGGILDLFVENAILVENKFHGETAKPEKASLAAAMQGRRYAIALGAQVIFVVHAYKPAPGAMLSKTSAMKARPITTADGNRVSIRIELPYGAVVPSREAAASA